MLTAIQQLLETKRIINRVTSSSVSPMVVASYFVRPLGLMIVGPVVADLTRMLTKSFRGDIAGALAGWGISESRVNDYSAQIKTGAILMGVQPHDDDDQAYFTTAWKNAELWIDPA